MASHYEEFMKTKPYRPLNLGGPLTEALIVKAQKELGETEDVKARTIPQLRKLIHAEEGLVCPTDDAYLLQYLRVRRFNVQRAFSMIKNFYSVKRSNEDIFGHFDNEAMRRAWSMKAGFFLPYRDEEGCAVALIRMRKWDVDVANASETLTGMTMGALMATQDPACQVCGIRFLVDVRGASLKQIRSFIPRHAYLLAKAFANCIPLRFKGIHIYNESPIFQPLASIVKFFLSEKMRNRFHLHGDSQKHLHKHIPKAILPVEDFGGDNPNDIAAWFNLEVEKYYEMCHQMTTYGYRQ